MSATVWSDAASELARRLADLAVTDRSGAPAWTGDDLDASSFLDKTPRVVHGPLDESLLSGRAGIALALAGCARLPGADERWADLARRAARASVDRSLATLASGPLGWDGGALGVARAACVVADLVGDESLRGASEGLGAAALWHVSAEPGRLPASADLLGGVAGVLVGATTTPAPRRTLPLRRAALRVCVDRLGELAMADADGVRWAMATTDLPVAGLAHGASGVAFALRMATLAFGPDAAPASWDRLAEEALRWEAGLTEPASGGWPDLRSPSRPSALAWCHGAPGIGACAALTVRLGSPGRSAGSAHATYLRATRAARLHRPAGDAFDGTLCHGLGGVVELHLLGAQAWGEAASEHLRSARTVASALVGTSSRWTCGLPVAGLTPNLLVGLAGVALTLVRCHDPALAPSPADPTLGWAP